jgi:hypothetical protein
MLDPIDAEYGLFYGLLNNQGKFNVFVGLN